MSKDQKTAKKNAKDSKFNHDVKVRQRAVSNKIDGKGKTDKAKADIKKAIKKDTAAEQKAAKRSRAAQKERDSIRWYN